MAETKPARRYTPEDKRRGLIALLVAGNGNAASEQTGIPRQTLENWRNTETELYAKLSQEHGQLIDHAITAQVREAVVTYGQIERQLQERALDNITRIDARDLPAALKNISAAKAQSTDKLLLLTGRATDRIEHVDARDLLADIRKIVQPYAIDSTAQELSS
jgi:transposase-like protein